jgi:hypothetical protein
MSRFPHDPLLELLEALRQPGTADELAGEDQRVARIAAEVRAAGTVDQGRHSMTSRRFRLTLTAAVVGAALAAMSGLAFAGSLPAPAQGVASSVLDRVGVEVPGPNEHAVAGKALDASSADDQSADTGATDATGDTSGEDTGGTEGDTGGSADQSSEPSGNHGKGKTISELAHSTPAPGKGKVIAPVASGGKSHVGNPPGQANTGDAGHKPDHPVHPDHPSQGGGNGHQHGGSGAGS